MSSPGPRPEIPHLGSADRGQAAGGAVLTAAELGLLLTQVVAKVVTKVIRC